MLDASTGKHTLRALFDALLCQNAGDECPKSTKKLIMDQGGNARVTALFRIHSECGEVSQVQDQLMRPQSTLATSPVSSDEKKGLMIFGRDSGDGTLALASWIESQVEETAYHPHPCRLDW